MVFGEYIKQKRQEKNITLRAFADLVGIAPSYMSDIEKSKRNAPTQEILDKMIEVLNLSEDEKNELLDVAATSKDAIAQDLTEYVSENPNVRVALRKAKDLNLGDDEWIRIIEEMISKK
jgi:transcriptional regulator with XRE-family HTH domain